MAQYYGDQERSQLGEQKTPAFERDNDGRSDDLKNELQAEGYKMYSGEPENVTYYEEEIQGRSVDASVDEREQPSAKRFDEYARGPGRVEGESDFKGSGNEDAGYENTAEQPITLDERGQTAYSEEKPEEGPRSPNQDVAAEERTMSDAYEQPPQMSNVNEQPTQSQYESNEEMAAKQPAALYEAGRTAYSGEKPAEEQSAPNQDVNEGKRVLSDGYEQSPYTNYESKEDFDKKAYGGEGYQHQPKPEQETGTAVRGEENYEPNPGQQTTQPDQETGGVVRGEENYQPNPVQQKTQGAEPRFSFPAETEQDDGNQARKPGENLKAKVLETLIPCHKTDTLDDDEPHDNGVARSPGFLEKVKEKLTGKPKEPAPEREAAQTSPKKNVFEKVKEKLSPST